MIYSLDTNVCIVYLNARYPTLLPRFQTISSSDIAVCSIVRAELFYGAAKSNDPAKTLARQEAFLQPYASLPFDEKSAQIYGKERGRLEKAGISIGPLDLLIAAVALANNLILVTNNTREFSRISGLQLENWQNLP